MKLINKNHNDRSNNNNNNNNKILSSSRFLCEVGHLLAASPGDPRKSFLVSVLVSCDRYSASIQLSSMIIDYYWSAYT